MTYKYTANIATCRIEKIQIAHETLKTVILPNGKKLFKYAEQTGVFDTFEEARSFMLKRYRMKLTVAEDHYLYLKNRIEQTKAIKSV